MAKKTWFYRLSDYEERRRRFDKILPIYPQVFSMHHYKKRRRAESIKIARNLILDSLKDIEESLEIIEDFLRTAENDYGSKILRQLWTSSSSKEKKAFKHLFEELKRKSDNIEKKILKPAPYKGESS